MKEKKNYYFFQVIWAVVLVVNPDKCFFRRRFNLMILLLGFVRISLLARIVVDPIIAFFTDFQVYLIIKDNVMPKNLRFDEASNH